MTAAGDGSGYVDSAPPGINCHRVVIGKHGFRVFATDDDCVVGAPAKTRWTVEE